MNNFKFETQGVNTYLIYEIESKDVIDTTSVGMLTNNIITGLAPMVFTQMDDVKTVKYNISSKISLRQFLEDTVKRKMLTEVILGIIGAVLSAEDYMIDGNSIVFDWDYIFVHPTDYSISMLCLPVVPTECENVDFNNFFKNIIFNIRFDESENCDYITQIIKYLNCKRELSLADFKLFISKLRLDSAPAHAVVENLRLKEPLDRPERLELKASENAEMNEKYMSVLDFLKHYSKKGKEAYRAWKRERQDKAEEYFNAVKAIPKDVPGDIQGETTVLGIGAPAAYCPHLIRVKNNERVMIEKPLFKIGKEKDYVDYFIGDNNAISRHHANIISRNGKYFVADINSTNHTYVDGQMIGSGIETEIKSGTRIRFANEEFEFKKEK